MAKKKLSNSEIVKAHKVGSRTVTLFEHRRSVSLTFKESISYLQEKFSFTTKFVFVEGQANCIFPHKMRTCIWLWQPKLKDFVCMFSGPTSKKTILMSELDFCISKFGYSGNVFTTWRQVRRKCFLRFSFDIISYGQYEKGTFKGKEITPKSIQRKGRDCLYNFGKLIELEEDNFATEIALARSLFCNKYYKRSAKMLEDLAMSKQGVVI